MESTNKTTNLSTNVRDMVISALLIAMVFLSTSFIKIKLPVAVNGGLIHLGNTTFFIAALVFGAKKGAIAGGVGMALFDFFSEWAVWTPYTFVVRGIMGFIIGTIAHIKGRKGSSVVLNSAALLAGSLWMIVGYYLSEAIMTGNLIVPATSIPGNIIQLVIGAAIALPASAALKKTKLF